MHLNRHSYCSKIRAFIVSVVAFSAMSSDSSACQNSTWTKVETKDVLQCIQWKPGRYNVVVEENGKPLSEVGLRLKFQTCHHVVFLANLFSVQVKLFHNIN